MEWINFRHLYAFWMVWKCGGFRKASSRIRVAQSAISDQVAQLEDYLGKKLLIRSQRKIELTSSGRELIDYAEIIFSKSRDINSFLKDDLKSWFPASLNIGIVGGISRNFVSKFICKIQSVKENLYCKVITGSASDLFEKLHRNDLHIVFSIELPQNEEISKFAYRKLLTSSICLAGHHNVMEEIRKHRITSKIPLYEFIFNYEEDVSYALKKYLNLDLQVSTRSDDIPLLRFLANSTSGVAIIPQIGVLDDSEKDQIDIEILPTLGQLNMCGFFSKTGPYNKVAEHVLEAYHS